jgi:hypothetical protein
MRTQVEQKSAEKNRQQQKFLAADVCMSPCKGGYAAAISRQPDGVFQ